MLDLRIMHNFCLSYTYSACIPTILHCIAYIYPTPKLELERLTVSLLAIRFGKAYLI